MNAFLQLSIVFAVASVVAWFMQRLKLPLLLGYVLTGMVAGPFAFGWLQDGETMAVFSKIGITALLFIVGLNLNPITLRDVGRVSILAGLGQIFTTTILGFLIASVLGYGWIPAAYIAIALTFSSTIIVLKILQDKRDLGKLYGKIAVGILLVQDLMATLVMVTVTAAAAGGSPLAFMAVTIKLFAAGAALWFVARFVLPRLVPAFANSQEFLLLFAVAWGMGVAALFHQLGFSIEIGALAAGVALATSPYHLEISAKMKLLRDFFLVLFFVLLGSQIGFGNVGSLWLPVLVFSAYVMIGNPLILLTIMGALGYRKKTSFFVGLTVAQISEFSLVLIVLGHSLGHVSDGVVTVITLVGLITFTGSSLLMNTGERLFRLLRRPLSVFERKTLLVERRALLEPEAILFGAHRLGHDFLPLLEKQGRPYVVVDFNPAMIRTLREQGVPCIYGDAGENELLDEFDLKKLTLVISSVPDFETNRFMLGKLRKKNATAVFVTIASNAEEAIVLYREGADYVILPHYLGGNYAALMLERYGLNVDRLHRERDKHLKHLETRLAIPVATRVT